jgi:amino acid adenylation domain-containing protein
LERKTGGVSSLQLPTDFERPLVQSAKGAVRRFDIDKELSSRLQELGQQYGATLFMTLLAAFKVLLYKYSGQEDICVGTPIAGRNYKEVEGLIGFFLNTIALRSEVNGNASFTTLLEQVKTTTLDAYKHQDVPFEKVVEAVVKERDMSRSPVFQVMFILQNTPEVPALQLGELELSTEPTSHNTTIFDITFLLTETAIGLQGTVEFSTELYTGQTVKRMMGHFKQLLYAIVEEPDQKLSLLQMLSRQDIDQLLLTFNDTRVAYPPNETIVDLFEKQVIKTPSATALVFQDEELSYQLLNEHSNRLARYLRSVGVEKETLVAICVERGIEMVIGIMGILKAGGAYLPIDSDYPVDRISYILQDSGAKLVLVDKKNKLNFPAQDNFQQIEIERELLTISNGLSGNLDVNIEPCNLAYVIYTSGSTGRPKGVMVEHAGVVNLSLSQAEALRLKPQMKTLQFSSIGFDASCYEIFNTLLSGGCLVLCRKEDLLSAEGFKAIITQHQVEVAVLPPSYQHVVTKVGGILKTVISAGEKLNEGIGRLIQSQNIRLINAYGPTENTVCVTLTDDPIKGNNRTVIGKPISNVQVYILDKASSLLPVGSIGEICVGGAQVARGYLNRPELTEKLFMKDPFSKKEGARLYKTGDLARWLPDGNLEYIGRIDEQVKIRGYRIELGEIEGVLQESQLVNQAVIVARDDKSGGRQLVGYIVADEGFDKTAVISYLKTRLPEYMVPAFWVELEKLPLSPNGKVDRKALSEVDGNEQPRHEYTAPRNETEQKLADRWQELLRVEKIGIHDNFFELGGHSILAMQVISSIRNELKCEVSIRELFIHPTISALAENILNSTRKEELLATVERRRRPKHIPLSFSQQRLWFIDKLEGSVQYHIPAVLKLKGKLDKEALQYALQTIVERHEVLRTIFLEHDEQGYQHVMDKQEWQLRFVYEASFRDNLPHLQQYVEQLISTPFDLSKDYMLRAELIALTEEEHILVVTMHHIASDAWSLSLVMKELTELYAAYTEKRNMELAELPVQYADYALWQNDYLKGKVLDKKLGYWKEKLAGVAPLRLPVDYMRPAVQSTKGAMAAFFVEKDLAEQLHLVARQQGATLFMTLLAAFKVFLFHYSGQNDICVGTPVSGRRQTELENLVGFFVNTLALRSNVSDKASFNELLQQVKETLLEAHDNQDVPFEKVVEAVVQERDRSRNPLFQVMFVLQNNPHASQVDLGELQLSNEAVIHNTSKFDLTFFVTETSAGLNCAVEFSTDLYDSKTIDQFILHFKQVLTSIALTPQEQLGNLSLLTSLEQQELIKVSTIPVLSTLLIRV